MTGMRTEIDRDRLDAVVEELALVLRDVAGEELPQRFDTSGPESIRRLGLTSVRILEFVVELEDRLGVEWDEGLGPETIASFEAMALFVLEGRSRR